MKSGPKSSIDFRVVSNVSPKCRDRIVGRSESCGRVVCSRDISHRSVEVFDGLSRRFPSSLEFLLSSVELEIAAVDSIRSGDQTKRTMR